MKKLTFMTMVAFAALLFTSCGKTEYSQLVGTWGMEKIEYYNTDYAGNPIPATVKTYEYDYDDPDNSIQMTFREDKTGEIRDSAIDTIWTDYNEETGEYETVIPCSDTVLISRFTFVFNKSDQSFYMNMEDTPRPYRAVITRLTNEILVYENQFDTDYTEKAYMRRINKTSTKSAGRSSKEVRHPHKMPGSIFGLR